MKELDKMINSIVEENDLEYVSESYNGYNENEVINHDSFLFIEDLFEHINEMKQVKILIVFLYLLSTRKYNENYKNQGSKNISNKRKYYGIEINAKNWQNHLLLSTNYD